MGLGPVGLEHLLEPHHHLGRVHFDAEFAAQIAAEFQVLAGSYRTLIDEVTHLRQEWQVLQDSAGILTIQILALCLVAFAAPFRLGKSIVDLMLERVQVSMSEHGLTLKLSEKMKDFLAEEG